MRTKLLKLLEEVNTKVRKTEEIAHISHEDASELGRGATFSRSTAGERFHAEQQATLNKEKYEELKAFQKELEEAITQEPPTKAEPICYLKLEQNGDQKEYFFVEKPVHLTSFSFISTQSSLGQKLLGKKVGESQIIEIG